MSIKLKRLFSGFMIFFMLFSTMLSNVYGNENESKKLICNLEESDGHIHNEDCICKGGELICSLVEQQSHTHNESCYKEESVLNCGIEAHEHTDECYDKIMVCGNNDSQIHEHSDDCYVEEKTLVCTNEENELHTHNEDCYKTESVLNCNIPEGHVHTDSCYEYILNCDKEEHVHTEDCYKTENVIACGLVESEGHVHTGECYCTGGEYICGLEENNGHTHTDECYISNNGEILSSNTTTVYFGNNIPSTHNGTVRYSAVSFREKGTNEWNYSNYFAPLSYGDCSEGFQLSAGEYEFVMNISFKSNVSAVTGEFTVSDNGKVENLITDAPSGAEILEQDGEYMIVACDDIEVTSSSYSRKFFKVLQPSGLTEEETAKAVSFYRSDGSKLGVYSYSSGGTISVSFPSKIIVNGETTEQNIYYYEVSIAGYETAKGSISVDGNKLTWAEDEDAKAENIVNSSTAGYQVYLAPASKVSVPLNIISDTENTVTVITNTSDNTVLEKNENGIYDIPISKEETVSYIYEISSDNYVTFQGSFDINSEGVLTDTTTDEQKENAIAYDSSKITSGSINVQLIPKIEISEFIPNPNIDGGMLVDITSQMFPDEKVLPGDIINGKFVVENTTGENLYIVGYDITVKDENSKSYNYNNYLADKLFRIANEPLQKLYNWDIVSNDGHDSESTLAELVYVDDKIKEVYENDEEYKNVLKNTDYSSEEDMFTYPAYLLYYFKTNYPDTYGNITSITDFDDYAIKTIWTHFNKKTDVWYGPKGREFGDKFDTQEKIDNGLYNELIYQDNNLGYAPIETYNELDQLLKDYIYKNGLLYSFDDSMEKISLYDWSVHTDEAENSFKSVLGENNILKGIKSSELNKTVENNENTIKFNNVVLDFQGDNFSNVTQTRGFSFGIALILSLSNEPIIPPDNPDVPPTVEDDIDISVKKEWSNMAYVEDAPSSITVWLLQNGKRIESIEITNKSDWKGIFENQPLKDSEGNKYVYTVEEEEIKDFITSITGNTSDGFVITNTYRNNGGETITPTYPDDTEIPDEDTPKVDFEEPDKDPTETPIEEPVEEPVETPEEVLIPEEEVPQTNINLPNDEVNKVVEPIEQSKTDLLPKTNDNSNIIIWSCMAILSLFGILICNIKKIKKIK